MKSYTDMPKILKMQENLFFMAICTSIPPEEKHLINDELKKCGLSISGTSRGWMLEESIEPVKCSDYEDRWHYVCTC